MNAFGYSNLRSGGIYSLQNSKSMPSAIAVRILEAIARLEPDFNYLITSVVLRGKDMRSLISREHHNRPAP